MELILCEVAPSPFPELESLSPFCVKVHRALKLQKHVYTRRHGRMPSQFSDLNPRGQVPVLLVDDEAVFDSTEILKRLEVPAEGEAPLWEELADTALNGYLVAARWADDDNWPVLKAEFFGAMPAPIRAFLPAHIRRGVIRSLEARDIWRGGAAVCWMRFEELLDQLEQRTPEDGFWVGDHVTVADLAIFAQLHSLRTDLTPRQRSSLAKRLRLSTYLDRVHQATS